jgi:hypothetical protein
LMLLRVFACIFTVFKRKLMFLKVFACIFHHFQA